MARQPSNAIDEHQKRLIAPAPQRRTFCSAILAAARSEAVERMRRLAIAAKDPFEPDDDRLEALPPSGQPAALQLGQAAMLSGSSAAMTPACGSVAQRCSRASPAKPLPAMEAPRLAALTLGDGAFGAGSERRHYPNRSSVTISNTPSNAGQ